MDERQAQIREGAGLEESKLNVEFIEWLRRWSTPLLLVAALAALAWVGYQKYEQAQLRKVDVAFAELDTALAAGSPETLKAVADAYPRVRAVPILARMGAADAYLGAARAGVRPGASLKPDGTVEQADVLSEGDRDAMLTQARDLFARVLSETEGDPGQAVHAIGAAYGLAAVAETRGDTEGARQHYERVVALAEKAGFPAQAAVAKERVEELPKFAEAPKLFAKAELPEPPAPPTPEAPAGAPGATGPTGAAPGPAPAPTGVFSPPAAPAPAPTGDPGQPSPAPTGEPSPTGAPPAPTGAPPPP